MFHSCIMLNTESNAECIRNTPLHNAILHTKNSVRMIYIFTIPSHVIPVAQYISTVVFVA